MGKRLGPMRTSLERTIDARELGDRADLEAVVQLARRLARQLDDDVGVSAGLVAQYRLVLAKLLADVPKVDTEAERRADLARLRAVD